MRWEQRFQQEPNLEQNSQNSGMVGVGRDLWGSPSLHLEQVTNPGGFGVSLEGETPHLPWASPPPPWKEIPLRAEVEFGVWFRVIALVLYWAPLGRVQHRPLAT